MAVTIAVRERLERVRHLREARLTEFWPSAARLAVRSSRLDVPESRQSPARCASVQADRVFPGPDGDA